MAEETGRVSAAREAILRLRLTAGEAVECLVDTGFTGALVLPQSLVARLGIPIVGREVFEMVGGRQIVAGVALAEVEWLGSTRTVRVIVSEDTLLGTELLDGIEARDRLRGAHRDHQRRGELDEQHASLP